MNNESRIKNHGKLENLKTIIHNSLFMIHIRSGFTLIEILVAITMIGVLSATAVAMINPLEQIKKGRDAQRKHDLNQFPIIMEGYVSDFKRYPEEQNGLIKGIAWGEKWEGYLAKLPIDPLSPQQDYSYEVDTPNGSWYRLCARLERCNDPQRIPEAECSSYNYSISSPNITNPSCAGTIIAPTPTPIPTSTPTPIPTSTPTPTPTPVIRRVFVTSETYNGNLGGINGADSKCQERANAAGIGAHTWKAWISDSSNDAIGRINVDAEFHKLDTTLVVISKSELSSGSIRSPINITETGSVLSFQILAWTGTSSNGIASLNNCSDWLVNVNARGKLGSGNESGGKWTDAGDITCAIGARLYCFEQ